MNNNAKDQMLFFGGLVMGSLTGVFGTIFYQFMYDMAKATPTFLLFVGVSGISFFVLMIYMSMKVIKTAKQLHKSNIHAKRTREISYMPRRSSPFRNQRVKTKKSCNGSDRKNLKLNSNSYDVLRHHD